MFYDIYLSQKGGKTIMSKQVNISEEIYKKFQAALMLTGQDEETVLNELVNNYAVSAFEKAMGRSSDSNEVFAEKAVISNSGSTAEEQKQLFVNWFRSLTRNGRPYNPVTISGYTGRIENACSDSVFAEVPVDNLFEITDLSEFVEIQKQLKACNGYFEYDAKSHNGFTAALKKYEDFLRFQSGGSFLVPMYKTTASYPQQSSVHRWTMEEDLICCKQFLEYYVVKKSNIEIIQFLKMLSVKVPDVSEGSLRMKIQNIKYLSVSAGFSDSAAIKWLSQYSVQCEKAFKQAVKELNLK